jgi:hypothetical protein
MKKHYKLRKFLSNYYFIHGLVLLGLLSLLGYVMADIKLLAIAVAASFGGAICGSFIRVIDAIEK